MSLNQSHFHSSTSPHPGSRRRPLCPSRQRGGFCGCRNLFFKWIYALCWKAVVRTPVAETLLFIVVEGPRQIVFYFNGMVHENVYSSSLSNELKHLGWAHRITCARLRLLTHSWSFFFCCYSLRLQYLLQTCELGPWLFVAFLGVRVLFFCSFDLSSKQTGSCCCQTGVFVYVFSLRNVMFSHCAHPPLLIHWFSSENILNVHFKLVAPRLPCSLFRFLLCPVFSSDPPVSSCSCFPPFRVVCQYNSVVFTTIHSPLVLTLNV